MYGSGVVSYWVWALGTKHKKDVHFHFNPKALSGGGWKEENIISLRERGVRLEGDLLINHDIKKAVGRSCWATRKQPVQLSRKKEKKDGRVKHEANGKCTNRSSVTCLQGRPTSPQDGNTVHKRK